MKRLVLLVDPPRQIEYADLSRHDMEGYTPLEAQMTLETISSFAENVCYTNIAEFIDNLPRHKEDLVFPMIWGRGGRNTKMILPAVCEAEDIAYIGADAYTQALCYDKYLAKKYAEAFGFKTPNGFMLFSSQKDADIKRLISYLRPPLIVKPNFGGGSCGISDQNLVDAHEDAFAVAKRLFENKYDPVLVEEYVEGAEVSILLLGNRGNIPYCGETQLVIDNETYFPHRIWGFETKKLDFMRAHYQVCSLVPETEHERAKALFRSLQKAEYLRVDGRLNQQGFFVLELSADCYLGPNCDFGILFESMGKNYAELLRFLAENALSPQDAGDAPIA